MPVMRGFFYAQSPPKAGFFIWSFDVHILVVSDTFTDKSTGGLLFVDGEFECYTLEDKVREVPGQPVETWKVPKETAIPAGIYDLIMDFSHRFGCDMPHILNVPGFTGVRLHSGNCCADTEGCLLVGRTRREDWVSQSRSAFFDLVDKIDSAYARGEKITIEIKRGEQ